MARQGAKIGSKVGSVIPIGGTAVGAALGAISGFILGDREIVFPIDMVAVPAYELPLMYQGKSPSFQIYIKEGEVLNQVQMTDAQESEAMLETGNDLSALQPKKPRKRSKWNIYTSKKANQIRFKSGKKKGLLNLKKMGVAYRKMKKESGK